MVSFRVMSEVTPNATPDPLQSATAEQRALFEELKNALPNIEYVPDMVGEDVFTVPVDESDELEALKTSARALRDLSFQERIEALKKLTLDAVGKNAVALASADPEAKELVYTKHPLSDALKSGKGCCRYQALLFFILAREAKLGVSHSLLTQCLGPSFFSVYNLVFDENHQPHVLSLYNESLIDPEDRKKFGYPNPSGNPMIGYDFSSLQRYYAYVAPHAGDERIIIKGRGNKALDKWNTDLSQLR